MRKATESTKPYIVTTLESINPLPVRHRDGKLVADWNIVHWEGLSEPCDYLMRLLISILGIDANDLTRELFHKDEENYARVGIDIILARSDRFSFEVETRLTEAIHQYLHRIHPSPDQYSASLLPQITDTTCELSEARKIADEFLSRHGTAAGKRAVIKTPYLVQFADQVAQVSGNYGPKPIVQVVPQNSIFVVGAVDALCLSDRTLGLLLEKGKKMRVAFDEATQFFELRRRLGDQQWYEFLIREEVDAKGRIVSHLVSIGDEVAPPFSLFS